MHVSEVASSSHGRSSDPPKVTYKHDSQRLHVTAIYAVPLVPKTTQMCICRVWDLNERMDPDPEGDTWSTRVFDPGDLEQMNVSSWFQ